MTPRDRIYRPVNGVRARFGWTPITRQEAERVSACAIKCVCGAHLCLDVAPPGTVAALCGGLCRQLRGHEGPYHTDGPMQWPHLAL